MCLLLREALTVGRISFHKHFHSNEMNPGEAKRRVADEMNNYCVVTEAPKTTFGKVRKTYTGKLYGRQDDVVIALQLALIGCQKFFQDPKYRSFRGEDWATPRGFANMPQPAGRDA